MSISLFMFSCQAGISPLEILMRALRPGGRLLVVDFAPHGEESLRSQHAHRRLGFAESEVNTYLAEAGLRAVGSELLAPGPGDAAKLAVSLWLGADTRVQGDFPARSISGSQREVA